MNQILISEKLYVTPEIRRKKKLYKIEFFISIFLVVILFSYYIYAEYDKSRNEAKSHEILASLDIGSDVAEGTTIRFSESSTIVVLNSDDPEDLVEPFTRIANEFPRVILASRSAVRKQQLIDNEIPFEVMISDADETPDESKSFKDQLAEIAMRKAMTVFEETKERGRRLIIAGDQNIVFDGKMYGKPESIDDARNLLKKMSGSNEVYAYTGNAILLAEKYMVAPHIIWIMQTIG